MSELIEHRGPGSPAPHLPGQEIPPPDFASQSSDLRWLWLALLRHRLLIFLTLCCTLISSILYINLARPLYRATATIQLDPESAKVLPYRDVSDSMSNPLPHFELYMKTQDEVLRSATLQARVAERLRRQSGDVDLLSSVEGDLSSGLQIQRVEGSQMVRIGYVASDPEVASMIANAWAEEYIKLNVERRYQTSEKAADFLQEQLKTLKGKVEAAEADLIEYARTHKILNIDSKQESTIRQRFGYLNAETARAEKDLIAKRAVYEGLRKVSVEDFPESLKGPVISALETKAFELEQELVKLQAQFGEKWPAVLQKQQELATVRSQLTEAKEATHTRALKEADMHYSATLSEFRMLQKAFKEQLALVDSLNQASVEYNTRKRELDASEQLYQGLLQRLKETGVSAGLEIGNISIADRAQPVYAAYRPRKVLSISMAALLGLMLGVSLSIVLEYVNNTLRDPWDVEALGVSLLGWVPQAFNGKGRRELDDGVGTDFAPSILLPAVRQSRAQVLTESQHRARESYRTLCASILLSRGDRPPKTVLISSAVPKEGKTTTALALGQTLAEMSPPTLLIDADLRHPALARELNLDCPQGLSTFLAGGALSIQESGTPNLYVLPAGPIPPNPVPLISAARMTELLSQLADRFKFILIDSPPVLSVADAHVLAPKVEGVILVVRAECTPTELVRKAIRQLDRLGCSILGAVVNGVNLNSPQYSYYHKYYYTNDSARASKPS